MNDILARATAGFSDLAVDQSTRRGALEHLDNWLRKPVFSAYRPQIEALVRQRSFDALLDAFYRVLPFGTGGRRGAVGVGPNRINPWTVATAVQGHVAYLRRRLGDDAALSVVIAYDVRRFEDVRGVYVPGVDNPLLGLSSRDFAELAARVYVANGVTVHLQRRSDPRFLATPELSFAIRHLGAQAGINLSASHNPPDDNGVKVYNHLGGQEVPPHDEAMVDAVAQVEAVDEVSWEEAVESGRLHWLQEAVHAAYVDCVEACSRVHTRSARVVFTALHGAGAGSTAEVLEQAGFTVVRVAEQCVPDGAFPTVPFRAPNPEVPRALDHAIELAKRHHADLVLATDPDADRIGGAVCRDGVWTVLDGNSIAVLVTDHALAHWDGESAPLVVQTEVTTGLVARIARARGAKVVDHLLVGFKYIGDLLRELEEAGEAAGVRADVDDFAVGVEESHGVLVTPAMRDKDAAGGALYLAEAASLAKDRGETLLDVLDALYAAHGFVANRLRSAIMQGASGRERIEAALTAFRAAPPTVIGTHAVTAVHDRQDPQGPFGPIVSGTDAASRNVLVFELGDRGRVVLRPSGTEPKTKIYVEVRGLPGEDRSVVIAEAESLGEDFLTAMLDAVDFAVPRWALAASDLVAMEDKQAFANDVLPAQLRALAAGDAVEAPSAETMALYAPAVARWLATDAASPELRDRLTALWALESL